MKRKSLLFLMLMAMFAPLAMNGQTTNQLLSENFDSMSSISTSYSSTGWFAYNAGSGNNWTLNTSSSYANSGSNSAQVKYSTSYAANCYLVSKPFTVSSNMGELSVSLYERVRSSSYEETFEVFFVKASDVSNLAGVATATKYNAIASASYTNITYAQQSGSVTNSALAGQSVRVVVHCTSAADKYYLNIDDITVTEIEAEACPRPTDLTATNITNNSATISWVGDGQIELEYAMIPEAKNPYSNEGWYYYDNGTNYSGVGLDGNPFSFGVMFPAGTFEGDRLSAVRIYDYDQMEGTLTIYNDGTNAPSSQVYTTNISLTGSGTFVDFDVNTIIDPTKNVWVIVGFVSGATYVAATCQDVNGDRNGRWVEINGSWYDLANAGVSGQAFMIRAHFEESFNPTTLSWIPLDSDASSPYELTGLSATTRYAVRVRAYCGVEDGYSEWTLTTFITLDDCAAGVPSGLSTELMGNAAELSWSGIQENYNVRYRKGFVYDFESATPWAIDDFAPCTTYDGDGLQTYQLSDWTPIATNQFYGAMQTFQSGVVVFENGVDAAHGGELFGGFVDGIPTDVIENNNDFFITPSIAIQNGDVFEFWATSLLSNWGLERMKVGVYGGEGTISQYFAGSATEYVEVPVGWTKYSYDLSAFAGQSIQLAINCVSSDAYILAIDDVFVGTNWSNPISVTGATYTLENLDSQKNYIWQVQGVDCDGNGGTTDWSTSATFTTPEFSQFTKHITAFYKADGHTINGGYYLIASPIGTVKPENVTNMLTPKVNGKNTYDLYGFDQAEELEWRNYRQSTFNLEVGKGYLYGNNSNSEGVDLVFTGAAISGSTYEVTLTKANPGPGLDFPYWNLVGNPFPVDAYIADQRSFYTMNSGANEIIAVNFEEHIEPMTGVFVVYEEKEGEETDAITFTTTKPSKTSESVTLDLRNGNNIIDRAIVRFGQGRQLPKFQLNRNSTKLYIPQDGKDYAVVCSEEIGAMPVNFKAEDNGTYTMNFSCTNVGFAYLHLIDNKTGNDVDLLQTPSYSFEAKTTDYESRFKLVFATGDNSNDDNFAFFSNGSFVINNDGTAELQVIDIMGRILSSETINGCTNVNVNAAPGVYMLRLINGTDVKVQKVVVK